MALRAAQGCGGPRLGCSVLGRCCWFFRTGPGNRGRRDGPPRPHCVGTPCLCGLGRSQTAPCKRKVPESRLQSVGTCVKMLSTSDCSCELPWCWN